MPRARIPRAAPTGIREPREGMSSDHTAMVKTLLCLGCGCQACDPHHLLRADPTRGMGRKAADRFCVPICRKCHDLIHARYAEDDEVFFTERGIDARGVASALWTARGDKSGMERIVFRARQVARAAA
jgi:hypothetical protein